MDTRTKCTLTSYVQKNTSSRASFLWIRLLPYYQCGVYSVNRVGKTKSSGGKMIHGVLTRVKVLYTGKNKGHTCGRTTRRARNSAPPARSEDFPGSQEDPWMEKHRRAPARNTGTDMVRKSTGQVIQSRKTLPVTRSSILQNYKKHISKLHVDEYSIYGHLRSH